MFNNIPTPLKWLEKQKEKEITIKKQKEGNKVSSKKSIKSREGRW